MYNYGTVTFFCVFSDFSKFSMMNMYFCDQKKVNIFFQIKEKKFKLQLPFKTSKSTQVNA